MDILKESKNLPKTYSASVRISITDAATIAVYFRDVARAPLNRSEMISAALFDYVRIIKQNHVFPKEVEYVETALEILSSMNLWKQHPSQALKKAVAQERIIMERIKPRTEEFDLEADLARKGQSIQDYIDKYNELNTEQNAYKGRKGEQNDKTKTE